MTMKQPENLWATSVLSTLHTYQKVGKLCDYELASSDGTIVPVHECVLSATCPMLHLDGSSKQEAGRVSSLDCSKDVLLAFVNLIYTGQLRARSADVDSAFAIASEVGIMLQNIPIIREETPQEAKETVGARSPRRTRSAAAAVGNPRRPASQTVSPVKLTTRATRSTSKAKRPVAVQQSPKKEKGSPQKPSSTKAVTPVSSSVDTQPLRRSSRKNRGKNPLRDSYVDLTPSAPLIKEEPIDDEAEPIRPFTIDFEMSLVQPEQETVPIQTFPCRYCEQCFAVQAVRTRHERQHTMPAKGSTEAKDMKKEPSEEMEEEDTTEGSGSSPRPGQTARSPTKMGEDSAEMDEPQSKEAGDALLAEEAETTAKSPSRPDNKTTKFSSKQAQSKSRKLLKVAQKIATGKQKKKAPCKQPKSCPLCKQILSSGDALKVHMSSVHQQHRPFICSYCGKTYTQRAHLREHVTMHTGEKPFTCPKCGMGFRLRKSCVSHVARHESKETDGQVHECQQCGKTFDSRRKKESHERAHAESFMCTQCGKMLSSAANLKQHMDNVHLKLRPYQCSLCEKAFKQRSHLREHELIHGMSKPHICNICSKGFVSQRKAEIHEASCKLKTDEEKLADRTCPDCKIVFKNEKSLKRHRFKKHGKHKSRFLCSDCGKTLSSADALRNHKDVIHHGLKRFPCDVCGKLFSQKSHRTEHMRIHTGERPFACKVCDKTFSHLKNMQTHELTHSDLRPYPCGICSMRFKQRNALKVHQKVHTKERPFSCQYCGRTFPTKQSKDGHERTHTGERPFKCTYCDQQFARQSTLKVHERKHTGDKPYTCPDCGLRFSFHHRYRKHMKLEHGTIYQVKRRGGQPAAQPLVGIDLENITFVKPDEGDGQQPEIVVRVIEPPQAEATEVVDPQAAEHIILHSELDNKAGSVEMLDASQTTQVIEVPQELLGTGDSVVVKQETGLALPEDDTQTYYLVYEVPVDSEGEVTVESEAAGMSGSTNLILQ